MGAQPSQPEHGAAPPPLAATPSMRREGFLSGVSGTSNMQKGPGQAEEYEETMVEAMEPAGEDSCGRKDDAAAAAGAVAAGERDSAGRLRAKSVNQLEDFR